MGKNNVFFKLKDKIKATATGRATTKQERNSDDNSYDNNNISMNGTFCFIST